MTGVVAARSAKPLGMWLFVLSDGVTFAALFAAYGVLRLQSSGWPKAFSISGTILYAAAMTAILLASGFTVSWAARAMMVDGRKRAAQWLLVTVSGGLLFGALHVREWVYLVNAEKITPWSNPWGIPVFGGAFFALTGLHLLHVAAGVIYLSVLAAGIARGNYHAEDVHAGRIYWQFVDAVWLFLFPLVYLTALK